MGRTLQTSHRNQPSNRPSIVVAKTKVKFQAGSPKKLILTSSAQTWKRATMVFSSDAKQNQSATENVNRFQPGSNFPNRKGFGRPLHVIAKGGHDPGTHQRIKVESPFS
jgi:hypothetical protein